MLQPKGQKGYESVYVHRLVWEQANRCRVPKGFHVHHIDNNKQNNSIYNLSLVTQRLNNWFAAQLRDYKAIYETRKRNGFKIKTTSVCLEDGSQLHFDSMRQAAAHHNTCVSIVSGIINGRGPLHITHNDKTYKFVRKTNGVAKELVHDDTVTGASEPESSNS